jgi:hypothetical protein
MMPSSVPLSAIQAPVWTFFAPKLAGDVYIAIIPAHSARVKRLTSEKKKVSIRRLKRLKMNTSMAYAIKRRERECVKLAFLSDSALARR